MSIFLTSKNIIEKQSVEVLNISMNFENWVDSGVTLSNPVATISPDDGELSITNLAVSSRKITMTVSGGTSGQRYRINITVDTSESETLSGDGILKIRDR